MRDQSAKETLSGLASGAFADARNLARDTAGLLREYAAGGHKKGQIHLPLIAGAGAVIVGAILFCLMLIHLLAWGFPNLPVWILYGVVGIPVLGFGIGLMHVGRKRMKSFDPLRAQSATVMRDLTETVEHVSEAVEAARQSFHHSADSVREAFDFSDQFNKRPWAVMAGALSLGYLGGAVMHGDGVFRPANSATGQPNGPGNGRGTFAHLVRQFEPEIVQLEGLAIGALFGIVRDLLAKSAPQTVESELEDIMAGIAVKLGGTPVQGQIHRESSKGNGAHAAPDAP